MRILDQIIKSVFYLIEKTIKIKKKIKNYQKKLKKNKIKLEKMKFQLTLFLALALASTAFAQSGLLGLGKF